VSIEEEPDRIDLLRKSVFGALPDGDLRRLAPETRAVDLPSGQLIYEPEVSVVARGLVRAFIADGAGRQLTIGYLRPGSALALARLAGRRYPVAFQPVVDARLLVIGNERTLSLQTAHPALGWATARELSARIDELAAETARIAFGSVRQRLAHHLLQMTTETPNQPIHLTRLVTAIGSPREVISRTLAPFRDDGTVHVDGAGIVIVNRRRLEQRALAS
jgi:CRP/FNR family transcriptional regulator